MFGSEEEILADIDHTLDQLIKNAVALRQIAEYEAFTADCAALHKMQHSLTARVVHMRELLTMLGHDNPGDEHDLQKAIQKKIIHYKKLNNTMIDSIAKRFTALEEKKTVKRKPRIGHNRRKAPARLPLKTA